MRIDLGWAFVLAAMLAGCASGVRSGFRPTDPTFSPRPGPTPRVYLDPARVPQVRLRSVGLIKVKVPASSGIERAVEAAAAKGRELGCWILVEHSVFAEITQSSAFTHGAILVHGPAPHVTSPRPPPDALTTEFDCVFEEVVASRSA